MIWDIFLAIISILAMILVTRIRFANIIPIRKVFFSTHTMVTQLCLEDIVLEPKINCFPFEYLILDIFVSFCDYISFFGYEVIFARFLKDFFFIYAFIFCVFIRVLMFLVKSWYLHIYGCFCMACKIWLDILKFW